MTEINYFNPIHADQMIRKAVEANSAKVFDDAVALASGPRGFGYLCVSALTYFYAMNFALRESLGHTHLGLLMIIVLTASLTFTIRRTRSPSPTRTELAHPLKR